MSDDNLCSSVNETSDNVTEELEKMLNNTKTKKCPGKSSSESTDTTDCKKSESSESCSSSNTDPLCQLKADILKILEMINVLKCECCKNSHAIEKLEHKVKNLEIRVCKLEKGSDSESYQETLDRILSAKLDELSIKVDNKINDLNKYITNTRNIAIMKKC